MTIVYMSHLRSLKYCSKGVRKFFIKYELDFNDFLKNGIDEETLKKTNDAMAFKAIEKAKEDGR